MSTIVTIRQQEVEQKTSSLLPQFVDGFAERC